MADEIDDGPERPRESADPEADSPAPSHGSELIALPYHARQRITLVDDDVIDAAATEIDADAEPLLSRTFERLRDVRPRNLIPGRQSSPTTLAPAEAVRALTDLRRQGVDVMPVARTAASELSLPVGHPRDGVVYLGDPADARRYYPAADFHRRAFEHKFAEAIRLLMALGATRLTVNSEYGWSRDLAAELDVPVRIAARAGRLWLPRRSESALLFEARLHPRPPEMPEGLVWYQHEPTWQQMAEGRLRYGTLRDFELVVRYDEDYGVDVDVADKIAKSPLSMGGRFRQHQATRWRIEGEFGEPIAQRIRRLLANAR
ncbi:MAG: hypothetical protein ACR2NA_07005 [Solirubrobacterales bacterium]